MYLDQNQKCNPYIHTMWVHSNPSGALPEWVDLVKQYTVLTSCKELYHLNYLQTTMFFHGQSYQNPLVQFNSNVDGEPVQFSSLAWPDTSLLKILKTLQFDNPMDNLFATNGHPNEQGHQIIANLLISQIDSC